MKLVEVVIAKQTSDETRDRSLAFVRQVGKLPVIVHDSPGFLVNRVLFPYLLDAAELFENTRLQGAPDPVIRTDTSSDESHDYYWRLMRHAQRAGRHMVVTTGPPPG